MRPATPRHGAEESARRLQREATRAPLCYLEIPGRTERDVELMGLWNVRLRAQNKNSFPRFFRTHTHTHETSKSWTGPGFHSAGPSAIDWLPGAAGHVPTLSPLQDHGREEFLGQAFATYLLAPVST